MGSVKSHHFVTGGVPAVPPIVFPPQELCVPEGGKVETRVPGSPVAERVVQAVVSSVAPASYFAPYLHSGFVTVGDVQHRVRVLRDTGASISLWVRPKGCGESGETVLIRGVTGAKTVPLMPVQINCPLFTGCAKVGIVDYLPESGVDLIVGNDLACVGQITVSVVTEESVFKDPLMREVEEGEVKVGAVTKTLSRSHSVEEVESEETEVLNEHDPGVNVVHPVNPSVRVDGSDVDDDPGVNVVNPMNLSVRVDVTDNNVDVCLEKVCLENACMDVTDNEDVCLEENTWMSVSDDSANSVFIGDTGVKECGDVKSQDHDLLKLSVCVGKSVNGEEATCLNQGDEVYVSDPEEITQHQAIPDVCKVDELISPLFPQLSVELGICDVVDDDGDHPQSREYRECGDPKQFEVGEKAVVRLKSAAPEHVFSAPVAEEESGEESGEADCRCENGGLEVTQHFPPEQADCRCKENGGLEALTQHLPPEQAAELFAVLAMLRGEGDSSKPGGADVGDAALVKLPPCLINDLENTVGGGDNVVMFGSDWEEFLPELNLLLTRLTEAHLVVNVKKCKVVQALVKYLGYVIWLGSVRPPDSNVSIINSIEPPKNRRELRSFLACIKHYRQFLQSGSTVLAPPAELLKKGKAFEWSSDCQCPIMKVPDAENSFRLATEASDLGVWAVLLQEDDQGVEHPICYFGKKFSKAQCNYSVLEKEPCALILALQHFSVYVPTLRLNLKAKNQRVTRWGLYLLQYNLDIKHVKVTVNVVANCLPRA